MRPLRVHVFEASKRLVVKCHMPPALVLQHNTVALQPTSFDSAGATATAAELVCITAGGARSFMLIESA